MDDERIRIVWKAYMKKLMNVVNDWSGDLRWDVIEGPIQEFSDVDVREAVKQAKNGKAGEPTGLVAEMLQAAGEDGIKWLRSVCNQALKEGVVPDDWKKSMLVPVFKDKGDAMDCGAYRGLKMLEHAMKIWERLLETRFDEAVEVE